MLKQGSIDKVDEQIRRFNAHLKRRPELLVKVAKGLAGSSEGGHSIAEYGFSARNREPEFYDFRIDLGLSFSYYVNEWSGLSDRKVPSFLDLRDSTTRTFLKRPNDGTITVELSFPEYLGNIFKAYKNMSSEYGVVALHSGRREVNRMDELRLNKDTEKIEKLRKKRERAGEILDRYKARMKRLSNHDMAETIDLAFDIYDSEKTHREK